MYSRNKKKTLKRMKEWSEQQQQGKLCLKGQELY